MVAQVKLNTKIYPRVVSYSNVLIPQEGSLEDIVELRNNLTLQAQGSAVQISDKYDLPFLMIALDCAHKVSPEFVLRLKDGKRFLIYEHWLDEDIYRPNDIIIIDKVKKYRDDFEFEENYELNLEDFIKEFEDEDLYNPKIIKKVLQNIEKSIKKSLTTTLTGFAPKLYFLLVQHLLYGRTNEIFLNDLRITE